jgi:hypothetical protein
MNKAETQRLRDDVRAFDAIRDWIFESYPHELKHALRLNDEANGLSALLKEDAHPPRAGAGNEVKCGRIWAISRCCAFTPPQPLG